MATTGGHEVGMWDDGAHENVRRLQISHDPDGINLIKFEYLDGTETVTGEQYSHGKISDHEHMTEEFELEPDEYITDVEAYGISLGNATGQVLMLIFKTNKRTSKAYGVAQPYAYKGKKIIKIVLGEKNKKIVGFRGNSDDRILHRIGVYVSPIKKKTLKQRVYKHLHQITNKFV